MSKARNVRQISPRELGMLALMLVLIVLGTGDVAAFRNGLLDPFGSSMVSGP